LQDVDFRKVLNEVKKCKDFSKITQAIGSMLINDLAIKIFDSKPMRNKSRLFKHLDNSLNNAQEMTKKFKFEEHFHNVVMSALEHYSEMYKVNPYTEIKGSYSPMELIIQGALYQN
jgi:hypothetical protein